MCELISFSWTEQSMEIRMSTSRMQKVKDALLGIIFRMSR